MVTPLRSIRVSDEEWALWVDGAAARGLSVSDLIRRAVSRVVGAAADEANAPAEAAEPPPKPPKPAAVTAPPAERDWAARAARFSKAAQSSSGKGKGRR